MSSLLGPFGPGLPLRLHEKSRRYSVPQSLVDAQKSRGFQYDGRTDPASGANEESTQTDDEAIGKAQIGRPLPGAIENQELLLNQNGLGDHRTDAARPQEPGNRNHDVDEKDDEIAHSVTLQERLNPAIVP
jgi:hypothetical protein